MKSPPWGPPAEAIQRPSGDQDSEPPFPDHPASCVGVTPAAVIVQIHRKCVWKAINVPSGDPRGLASSVGVDVRSAGGRNRGHRYRPKRIRIMHVKMTKKPI